jgi:hypothetical protein
MDIFIYDSNRTLVGSVESYEYLRWTRRYSKAGSFELRAEGTSDNAALLQIGSYLWMSDSDEVGIIEHLHYSMTDKEMITAGGWFATGLLGRRIIKGTEVMNGDLGAAVSQLVTNHLISPADTNRSIDFMTINAPTIGITVHEQVSYKNLLDEVTGLCEANEVGIKTLFNPQNGALIFTVYQAGSSSAVFAKEYENIISQTFTHDVTDAADTAYVAGEGEGSDRQIVEIDGASGVERREIYVDARDMQSEDFQNNYTEALTFRGQTKLAEHEAIQSCDAEVNTRSNLIYKVDYDIGQTVTIHARNWGVSITTRITEINEQYDETGLSLDVTFGYPVLSINEVLKEVVSGG